MPTTPDLLLDAAVAKYLGSHDFNGLPAYVAVGVLGCDLDELKAALIPLVESRRAAVLFGDRHPNPHIRAFADEPSATQLEKLRAFEGSYFVVYPTAATLLQAVEPTQFIGRPYALALALGKPQLAFASFDPIVLDSYRRDPRYAFWSNDIQGRISIGDAAYESASFPEQHKVLIKSFAFSYDDELIRAVAVFYTDLGRLSPEHQQMWAAYELPGTFRIHPDAYRALVIGDWNLKISLGDAFLEELRTINRMCELIGWLPLFKNIFRPRPKEFGFLLRPTRRELNDFVLLLDKMLSDNIDADFFPPEIARTTEKTRSDGKVVVQQRGTISMLEEWLNTSVRLPDPAPKEELLAAMKEIRKLRQKPAHSVDTDAHDPALFKEQRRLFLGGYNAVRTLRLILANHPRARLAEHEMNKQVRLGQIWSI